MEAGRGPSSLSFADAVEKSGKFGKSFVKKEKGRNSRLSNKAMVPPKGVHILFLMKKMPVLMPDMASMITTANIRKAFEQAKMTTIAYGPSRRHFEMDVDRNSRLLFVEFMLFICMLTKLLTTQYNNTSNAGFTVDISNVLKVLISSSGIKDIEFEEVPPVDEDENGVFKPSQMFRNGKMVEYKPPTPSHERDSVMSQATSENFN